MKYTNEQLDAIKKEGSNIIVSAGAGSGKTAVLTERVIRKLKDGISISDLLILTFTNNAASEMRDRIKNKILDEPSLLDQIKYVDSSDIKTFDAFVLSLVKKYYYLLDVDKNINIIDSSFLSLKKKEILDSIFDELYVENNEIFNSFITTFGVKNDKVIKTNILKLDSSIDLIIDKEEYLDNYISSYYNDDNLDFLLNQYEDLILRNIDEIKDLLEELASEVNEEYLTSIEGSLDLLICSTSYEEVSLNNNVSIPNLPRGTSENGSLIKKRIKELTDIIKDLTNNSKDHISKEFYSTLNYSSIIIDILSKLSKRVFEYKKEVNHFEYNDISRFAINLIKDNHSVREELSSKYQEIMVDEYQDNSDIQEEFISLLEKNNVYVVGDVKQSIYRFRNANPNLFKKRYNLYKTSDDGHAIDLNKNFRSRGEVLNNINEIFNPIMDLDIGNADYEKSHQLEFGLESYLTDGSSSEDYNLEIYNYPKSKNKAEIEAFIVANDIKSKIDSKFSVYKDGKSSSCSYSDFTILMDRGTDFDTYKKVFNYFKIPINLYIDENILENDETLIIKNIISFILNIKNKRFDKSFRYSFVSIARSYLFRLDDEEIFKIITSNSIYNSNIYMLCKKIADEVDFISNKELVERIIFDFNFYNKMIEVGNVHQRTVALDNIVAKMDGLSDLGIFLDSLVDYFDNLISSKEALKIPATLSDGDAVNLMNIHKSKGLEYRICYYTGLYKRFNLKDSYDKFIYSEKFGILLPSTISGIKSSFIKSLYDEDYIKEEISEKIRLFYVALTRCREKMIMVTSLDRESMSDYINSHLSYSKKIKYRSFQNIIESIYPVLDKYFKDVSLPEVPQYYSDFSTYKSLDVLDRTKISISKPSFDTSLYQSKSFSKNDMSLLDDFEVENMREGTRLHSLLENIDFKNPDYSKLSGDDLLMVRAFIENPVLKSVNEATIFKEYEFVDNRDGVIMRGVIDLMLAYDDRIIIVDYKLKNTSDSAYLEQLKGYKEFIEKKTGLNTEIYLYSIIEKKLISKN